MSTEKVLYYLEDIMGEYLSVEPPTTEPTLDPGYQNQMIPAQSCQYTNTQPQVYQYSNPQPQVYQYSNPQFRERLLEKRMEHQEDELHRFNIRKIDEEFDTKRLERLAEYHTHREMSSLEVMLHSDGSIWFYISIPGEKNSMAKCLFPDADHMKFTHYETIDGKQSAIVLDFDTKGTPKRILVDPESSSFLKNFERDLRKSVGRISISDKYLNDALYQVFNLLDYYAQYEQIPSHRGWIFFDDGKVMFIGYDQRIFKEVINIGQ